jgi:DNA-binding NarL/FixJ family response regulator
LDTKLVRAVVVDDSDDMRSIISEFVNRADVGVEVVATFGVASHALAWCRIDPPDVVVLDLHLPGVAGLEVVEAVLAQDPTQPIVLFSAFLHPAVRAEAERLGVRACVEKQDLRTLPTTLWEHGRRATVD